MPPSNPPRVFISYARSDGSEYAACLRCKLEEEHPEIKLWQDVIGLHSGKDSWLQITDALDHVAYMVLVATPDAMKSDAVHKELRYARQQGVCVLPVQASDALDFASLPRWMQTRQCADLKIKQQWDLFISDLHRPCETSRVPFMAEDPKQFSSQIVGRLLTYRRMPAIARFTDRVAKGTGPPWLRPLHVALYQSGSALVRTREGHTAGVRGVALSRDGRYAVSASEDDTLKLWEVESERELRTL
jgi:WD40 repeat protein